MLGGIPEAADKVFFRLAWNGWGGLEPGQHAWQFIASGPQQRLLDWIITAGLLRQVGGDGFADSLPLCRKGRKISGIAGPLDLDLIDDVLQFVEVFDIGGAVFGEVLPPDEKQQQGQHSHRPKHRWLFEELERIGQRRR